MEIYYIYKLYYYFILPSTTLKGMLLTGMCQAESPQTEVRRRVRDAALGSTL